MCNDTVADCFLAVEKDRRENPFFPVDRDEQIDELSERVLVLRESFRNGDSDAQYVQKMHILAAKVIRCLEGF